jgi:hypothetical protein
MIVFGCIATAVFWVSLVWCMTSRFLGDDGWVIPFTLRPIRKPRDPAETPLGRLDHLRAMERELGLDPYPWGPLDAPEDRAPDLDLNRWHRTRSGRLTFTATRADVTCPQCLRPTPYMGDGALCPLCRRAQQDLYARARAQNRPNPPTTMAEWRSRHAMGDPTISPTPPQGLRP